MTNQSSNQPASESGSGAARRQLNGIDFAVIVVVLIAVLGFGLAKAGHAGVDKIVKGKSKVAIDVFITGLKTKDLDLFKKGDKSAITIRNQPVEPPMTIESVQRWPKQVSFLSPDGKKAVAFADPANSIASDFLVTVVENSAEVTDDGFVIHGNKIKVGNQIELEAFKYRVQGVVADIKAEP